MPSNRTPAMATIFIAHSRHDQAIAADLEERLRARGTIPWVDFSRIPVGERFVEEIAGAFGKSSLFVLVSSEAAARSYWVSREVGLATRLRASGLLVQLVRLDVDGLQPLVDPFDRAFGRVEDAVDYLSAANGIEVETKARSDTHRIDFADYQARPGPRVWLGFSAELAAIDRWFFKGAKGLWVSGLGGSGKSSLTSVWITALCLIGYAAPQCVSVRRWNFYEAPDRAAALDQIQPWVTSAAEGTRILVLDGADESRQSSLSELHEIGWRFPELKIIVTSRQSVPEEYSAAFDVLALQSLDRAQADLLAARLGVDSKVFGKLFDVLQGHPLAVSLAAGLVEQGHDVDGVLRTINAQP
jgi:hypothetical protein